MSLDLPKCITDTSGIFALCNHNYPSPTSTSSPQTSLASSQTPLTPPTPLTPLTSPVPVKKQLELFDLEAYQAEQRAFWELKNIFGSIHTTIQRVLRKYRDNDWEPLSAGTYLSSIDASSGNPKVDNHGSFRNVIDIGWFYSLLELYYSYPVEMSVTCAQWQKFVGINNSLANIYVTVQQYSWMRAKMPKPEDFLELAFREPIPLIGVRKYWVMMKYCSDYDSSHPSRMEKLYPYYP